MATRKKSTAKKSTRSRRDDVVEVDFTDTEERKGGKQKYIAEGDYAVKVIEAKYGKSGNKETPQVVFKYKITKGPEKNNTIYHNCNLLPQSLWVLRNALEAMGVKVKASSMKLPLAKLVDRELAITIEDDEFDNKIRSRVADTFPIGDLTASKTKKKDEELDEDDEDEEDEEEEDEDEEDEEEDQDDEDEEEDDDEEIEDLDLEDI